MTLEEIKIAADAVAESLNGAEVPCAEVKAGAAISCIIVESTAGMRAGKRRAFGAYRAGRLCGACCAYWHATMCADTLRRFV